MLEDILYVEFITLGELRAEHAVPLAGNACVQLVINSPRILTPVMLKWLHYRLGSTIGEARNSETKVRKLREIGLTVS